MTDADADAAGAVPRGPRAGATTPNPMVGAVVVVARRRRRRAGPAPARRRAARRGARAGRGRRAGARAARCTSRSSRAATSAARGRARGASSPAGVDAGRHRHAGPESRWWRAGDRGAARRRHHRRGRVLEAEARRLNAVPHRADARPAGRSIVKAAVSADGRIAARPGVTTAISSARGEAPRAAAARRGGRDRRGVRHRARRRPAADRPRRRSAGGPGARGLRSAAADAAAGAAVRRPGDGPVIIVTSAATHGERARARARALTGRGDRGAEAATHRGRGSCAARLRSLDAAGRRRRGRCTGASGRPTWSIPVHLIVAPIALGPTRVCRCSAARDRRGARPERRAVEPCGAGRLDRGRCSQASLKQTGTLAEVKPRAGGFRAAHRDRAGAATCARATAWPSTASA